MKFNSTFALPAVIALSYLRLPVPIFALSPTRADDSKAQDDAIRTRRERSFDKKAAGGPLRKLMVNGDTLTSNTNDIVVDTLDASVVEEAATLVGSRGGPVPNLSSIGGVGEWISDLNVDGPPNEDTWFGNKVGLTKGGTRLAVSAYADKTNGNFSGKVTIYDKMDDGSWDVVKEFYGEQGDQYGRDFSFSDDGKRLAMVVTGDNAWVVWEESDDGSWNQIGYKSYCCNIFSSVAMSGDGMRFVAGDSLGGSNREGIAVIFEWDEGTSEWVEISRVGGDIYGESFTISVSMSYDGKRIIGGSPFVSSLSPDDHPGLARVFEQQDDGEWYPMGELEAEPDIPIEYHDAFGSCVAMSSSGYEVVVGAPYAKKATVFSDTGEGEWVILDVLESSLYNFGYSCSFSDDDGTIAIGSLGGVEIYDVKGDVVSKVGNTITVESPYTFGYSVSLSDGGGEVGIGGPQVGTGGIASVYKYNRPSPSRCVNSPLQFQVETVDGSFLPFFCKWASGENRKNLDCSDTGEVATHCPQVCRQCRALKCSDAEGSFFKQNGKETTCISVREAKNVSKLCKKSSIAETCRATCNYCE